MVKILKRTSVNERSVSSIDEQVPRKTRESKEFKLSFSPENKNPNQKLYTSKARPSTISTNLKKTIKEVKEGKETEKVPLNTIKLQDPEEIKSSPIAPVKKRPKISDFKYYLDKGIKNKQKIIKIIKENNGIVTDLFSSNCLCLIDKNICPSVVCDLYVDFMWVVGGGKGKMKDFCFYLENFADSKRGKENEGEGVKGESKRETKNFSKEARVKVSKDVKENGDKEDQNLSKNQKNLPELTENSAKKRKIRIASNSEEDLEILATPSKPEASTSDTPSKKQIIPINTEPNISPLKLHRRIITPDIIESYNTRPLPLVKRNLVSDYVDSFRETETGVQRLAELYNVTETDVYYALFQKSGHWRQTIHYLKTGIQSPIDDELIARKFNLRLLKTIDPVKKYNSFEEMVDVVGKRDVFVRVLFLICAEDAAVKRVREMLRDRDPAVLSFLN